MLALAATSGFSLGYAFGLTGFDDKDPLDEPPSFGAWMFRIFMVILIVGISIYGGVARTGDITSKIDQFLFTIVAYAIGVFLHRELDEFRINIGIVDRLIDMTFTPAGNSKASANGAMAHLTTYFFSHYLSDVEIAHSLKKLRAFKHADSLSLLVHIAQFKTDTTPPRRLLAQYGIESTSQLKPIFSSLLKIAADNYIFAPEFIQRLRLVATSSGLTDHEFESLYRKYKPAQGQEGPFRQAEPESFQSKYHPDRNMGSDKSEADRAKAAAKMTELNTAYDWLEDNWVPSAA